MANGRMIPDSETPRPDPTPVTTEQLMREISRLDTIIHLQVAAVDERLTAEIKLTGARFDAHAQESAGIRRKIDTQSEYDAAEQRTVKEVLGERLDAETKLTAERFRAQREALELAQKMAEEAYAKVVDAVETRALLEERLNGEIKLNGERFRSQQQASALAVTNSERALQAALNSAEKAVEKANAASDKRFESVNEFRAQLSDIQTTLLPRAEAEARMASLADQIGSMKSTVDKGFTGVDVRHYTGSEIRTDSRANLAIAISVVMGVLTIVSMIIINAMHIALH